MASQCRPFAQAALADSARSGRCAPDDRRSIVDLEVSERLSLACGPAWQTNVDHAMGLILLATAAALLTGLR